MAKLPGRRQGPRVRKSAPTVREQLEAARVKSEPREAGKLRRVSSKTAVPFRRLKIGQRAPARWLKRPLRPIGRGLAWLMPRYLVNSWRELRQVTWPKRRETWRLTLAVFIFAIVFGALVAGVDKGLDELFKKVILK